MQNKWMRYLDGYIDIRLYGDYVERLFNMCRSHGIELWNIKRDETSFCCSMAAEDFSRMHPLMRKTGTKVKVLHKNGLSFYIPFLKKRILFFIGIFACLFMLNWVTQYIWAIEYVGNMQISDDELTDFLREEGIHYGMTKASLNCEEKEKQLRAAFPVVTWTSIYFEGTKLYVEVKENEKVTGEHQQSQGMDIMASEDGVISSIITRNGIPQVKAGDTVEKGQILVSGAVPVYDDGQNIVKYQIYEADADITILTKTHFHDRVKEIYPVMIYDRNSRKGYFLDILGWYIESPMFMDSQRSYESVYDKRQVSILGEIYLPVFYGVVDKKPYHIQYCNYEQEQMQNILTEAFEKFILCLQEKGVQIIEKDVKMIKNRNGMEINADLLVIKPTGEKTVLQQENGQEE